MRLFFILLAFVIVVGILACAFSPAIAAFWKAGNEDGYTLEAFDTGDSPWWWVGVFATFGGLFLILYIAYKLFNY